MKPHVIVVYELYIKLRWPADMIVLESMNIKKGDVYNYSLDKSLRQDILDDGVVTLLMSAIYQHRLLPETTRAALTSRRIMLRIIDCRYWQRVLRVLYQ